MLNSHLDSLSRPGTHYAEISQTEKDKYYRHHLCVAPKKSNLLKNKQWWLPGDGRVGGKTDGV